MKTETSNLQLTQKELEKLILLMEDKFHKTGMFYKTKVLYEKLLNSAIKTK